MLTAIKAIRNGNKVRFGEFCDCGNHIRHNNGGNYHYSVFFWYEKGNYYRTEETTSELESDQTFKISFQDLREELTKNLSENWDYQEIVP